MNHDDLDAGGLKNVGRVTLPLIPIRGSVLFPGTSLPTALGLKRDILAVESSLHSSQKDVVIAALQPKKTGEKIFGVADFYPFATRAIISRVSKLDNGYALVLNGYNRVRIREVNFENEYLSAEVQFEELKEDASPETEATFREIMRIFKEIKGETRTESSVSVIDLLKGIEKSAYQIYLMSVILDLDYEKQQILLEASDMRELTMRMHEFISYELKVHNLRSHITKTVAGELGKEQREYVLRRELEEIHRELGMSSERTEDAELRSLIANTPLPSSVAREIEVQSTRLKRLSINSGDYDVIYAYIKYILGLPWSTYTEDKIDLAEASRVLDADHADLVEVKKRILEHLAVMKLNPRSGAPILCFVGPPGTGKTSLGQSIARALGRKFERMSLGGVHDEAELRGHRRTYVGAMPGRILEAIKRAGVNNPLIMLDEIDKIGLESRGDPASALMEILDPAQNNTFHDNYLSIDFDLSHVFFITTANNTDSISRALLDRMEVVRLSGYTDDEKMMIAEKYLIPTEMRNAGISVQNLEIPKEILRRIIGEYTREAGVRELRRMIAQTCRQVAMGVATGDNSCIKLDARLLRTFLGPVKILPEVLRKRWGIGIATGLAWTESGGDVIYIETSFLPDRKEELKITGHVGAVMRESVVCALSYIWGQISGQGIASQLRNAGVHIHIPAAAIPKDGPSAGVAIAVALLSLYLNREVARDIAFTGELTLRGVVLPVGGIKEKVLAANRAEIHRIVIPRGNSGDLIDIPQEVAEQTEFILVDDFHEVMESALLISKVVSVATGVSSELSSVVSPAQSQVTL